MSIGILTFHFADNYGAVLQAYALRSYLCSLGENAEIINYVSDFFANSYSINPLLQKNIKQAIIAFLKFPIKVKQARKFEAFRTQKLGINGASISDLESIDFDRIIVGSDQVWNFMITHNDMNYFLPINNVNKYAYAASANNTFVEEKYNVQVKNLLQEFIWISVREQQLKKVIEEKYDTICDVVLDPVFLMPEDFWKAECRKAKGVPDKYILVYALERNEKLERVAETLEKKLGIKILIVHPLSTHVFKIGKLLTDVGPNEFLGLIKNATVVVSNSFHAFAFSMIFGKEIYFDFVSSTSNRVTNMIELFDLKPDYVEKLDVFHVSLKDCKNKVFREKVLYSQKRIQDCIVKGKIHDDSNKEL